MICLALDIACLVKLRKMLKDSSCLSKTQDRKRDKILIFQVLCFLFRNGMPFSRNIKIVKNETQLHSNEFIHILIFYLEHCQFNSSYMLFYALCGICIKYLHLFRRILSLYMLVLLDKESG
jgi:hypothetical protein